MTVASTPQPSHEQQHTDALLKLGGWLFTQRSWLPVPLALSLVLIRAWQLPRSPALMVAGILVVAGGESLRLWAVHHIGVISRTRSDRLGPLVTSGPFAMVRNPLYLGNIALWIGFCLSARLVWMVPVVIGVLGFEYHAIVRWEEQLLGSRRGDQYRSYAARVPRWLPSPSRPLSPTTCAPSEPRAWRDTLFSERGTLIAIAVGYLLLWFKATV